MNRPRLPLFLGFASLCFAACDTGPRFGEPTDPSASQMQAATQINGSVDTISAIGADANNALGLYSYLATVGNQAVQPMRAALSLEPLDIDPTCTTGSATTGYTYNNCTSGGTTFNGSVKLSGQTVDIDLTISTSSQASNVKVTMKGSVTNTGTTMTGDLTYEIKIDLGGLGGIGLPGGTGSVKTVVTYDIAYSGTPSCISSGTVTVETEANGQGGAAQFVWTGCNMLKVRNGQ